MIRPGVLTASLIVSLLVASLAPVARVWAQTDPPPVSAAAPAVAPPEQAPPSSPSAPAAAPLPSSPAAPPAAAPPPALAAPAPPMAAEPGTLPALPPPEDHPPVYKQTWFWAVIAVVGLTAVMIAYGIGSQGPSTPSTDLGNMRAF